MFVLNNLQEKQTKDDDSNPREAEQYSELKSCPDYSGWNPVRSK
jgi:hypothetical protein